MAVTRIVVGVDGSANSRRALTWAASLAADIQAEVIAVHAVGLLEHVVPEKSSGAVSERERVLRRFENDWCAPLDAIDGLRSRRITEEGPPAMALLRVVGREAVELIVVGSRGIGSSDAFFLGSTTSQLLQQSPVPVTVIPPV